MANNNNSHIGAEQSIRDSIEKIAHYKLVDSKGVIRGTRKITGYVVNIDKKQGTVDVQEYLTDNGTARSNEDGIQPGLHKGVLLTALKDNNAGFIIVPKKYSDVTIVRDLDPHNPKEYVIMFSHVDIIQLDSHEQVTVGVQEREPYDETDEDGKTVEELEPTGVFSKTTYTKNSITTEVQDEDEANHSQITVNGEKIESIVGDNKSSAILEHDQIHLKHNKAETVLDDDQHLSQCGGSKVKITDGTVYVGDDSNTDDAVLGGALADILSEILGYLGQAMTTTTMGPQPLINMANYIAFKAKIEAWRAAHTQFLTRKVQIQK